MDLHGLLKVMSETRSAERSKYHLTLGGLIKKLESVEGDVAVMFSHDENTGPRSMYSYRGYYEDLAFGEGEVAGSQILLDECRKALGNVFEGYKGGDFVMTESTSLWCADDHSTGLAIIGIQQNGKGLVLLTKDIEND